MRTADYLIVGQGVAGSVLAWTLDQLGCKVIVTNAPEHDPGKRSFAVCKSSGFTISLSCSIPFHYPDELE